jgi:hypothetical protein
MLSADPASGPAGDDRLSMTVITSRAGVVLYFHIAFLGLLW